MYFGKKFIFALVSSVVQTSRLWCKCNMTKKALKKLLKSKCKLSKTLLDVTTPNQLLQVVSTTKR